MVIAMERRGGGRDRRRGSFALCCFLDVVREHGRHCCNICHKGRLLRCATVGGGVMVGWLGRGAWKGWRWWWGGDGAVMGAGERGRFALISCIAVVLWPLDRLASPKPPGLGASSDRHCVSRGGGGVVCNSRNFLFSAFPMVARADVTRCLAGRGCT